MKDIRLVALDLDGTTLRSNNTLSPAVKNSLELMIKGGVEVVAASGRPFGSMPREVLGIEGLRWVIASNGAAVYLGGKRVISTLLEPDSVLRVLELTADHDLIWEAFSEGETVTDKRYYDDPMRYGCSQAYVGYVRGSRECRADMRRYILENRGRLDSVEFVTTDRALRERLWKRLEGSGEPLYITSSSANFVELMHRDATKSGALKKICERLGIGLGQTLATGNADNDADMLRCAGTGAAVANATPKCLEAADILLPSNDEDGICELAARLAQQR